MGKEKKIRKEIDVANTSIVPQETVLEPSYEEKLRFVSVIAKPMASRKLTKKLFKLIKKGSHQKTYLRKGLKDVQRSIRKGETGVVIFAGDVSPVDMIIHLPGVCEDKQIPYCYTPSRRDIGSAMGTFRTVVVTMVREHKDYQELFDECVEEIKLLPVPM